MFLIYGNVLKAFDDLSIDRATESACVLNNMYVVEVEFGRFACFVFVAERQERCIVAKRPARFTQTILWVREF